MPGLVGVAEMIASIGEAAKMSAANLKEAATELDNYVASETAAAEVSAGMNKAGTTSPTALSLALQAQAGRR